MERPDVLKCYQMETFAEWIEDELHKRAWKPADLAREAGIKDATLSRILSGTRNAGPDVCKGIARALDMSEETVFRRSGILSPLPPAVEEERELVRIFRTLDRHIREYVMITVRALGRARISEPQIHDEERTRYATPRPSNLKEWLAKQLVDGLQEMSPEEQQQVLDYMRAVDALNARGELDALDIPKTQSHVPVLDTD